MIAERAPTTGHTENAHHRRGEANVPGAIEKVVENTS